MKIRLSKGFIFAFLAALTWAVSIIIAKVILQRGETAYVLAFWTAILAVPYWIYTLLGKKTEIKKLTKKDYSILFWIGIISTVGVGLTEALALRYSSAVNYSFLIRTVTLFTIIFAYFFLGEKLTTKKIILATLLLIGAYLLTLKGEKLVLSSGDIFTLIEAILIAFGNNVLGKMATNRMSTTISAAGGILMGIIPLTIVSYFNHAIIIPQSFGLIILLTIIYVILTKLRFLVYKNATVSFATMVYSFTPVFVSLMAIPLLGEGMTVTQIIGGVLIVIAGVSVEKLKI
ncbi:MAG: hypothetical protein UT13_C0001G0379 [Candidatus Pacebacteria bacterium GW2011_GWF2_38_9]|nr:MAG: hypothetical protein US20_C0016G0005 [Candidatus Pacebacteria bacterium GW2011_GWF1_36_5]KKQ88732.1 MAG: hypothetical protein UT13_C0001G0379 [Candidatus Pacebacteria bacterium GW2011_GWF2_38_9]